MPLFGHTGRRTAPLVISGPRTGHGSAARRRSELGMEPGESDSIIERELSKRMRQHGVGDALLIK